MWLLLSRTASRNGGIVVSEAPVGYGLWLILVLQLVAVALAKCPNWCSQHGVCTGPGDDAFCICEMGFQGDDCGISEFDMCRQVSKRPLARGENTLENVRVISFPRKIFVERSRAWIQDPDHVS